MILWFGAPKDKSSPNQIWWPEALWQQGYDGFSLSGDLVRPHDQRVMRIYGWEQPLIVSHHHLATFGEQRHCGCGDMFKVVDMISHKSQ